MNTSRLASTWLCMGMAFVAGLLACERGSTSSKKAPSVSQGVTNAQPSATASAAAPQRVDPPAVEALAQAWCWLERSCDRVGSERPYRTLDGCLTQLRGAVTDDVASYRCPHGLEAARIQPCMAAIERVDCTHLLNTLSALPECRSAMLCAP